MTIERYQLDWKKIGETIGTHLVTVGDAVTIFNAPAGFLLKGVGQAAKGAAELADEVKEKCYVDMGKDSAEKAFRFIFMNFIDALQKVLVTNVPDFKKKEKKETSQLESFLDSFTESLQGKSYSLLDFDEANPEDSELISAMTEISRKLIVDKEILRGSKVDPERLFRLELIKSFKDLYSDRRPQPEFEVAVKYLDQLKTIFPGERFGEKLRLRAQALGSKLIYDDFVLDQLFVAPNYGRHKFDLDHYSEEPEWQDEDIFSGIEKIFEEEAKVCVIVAPMGMGKSSFGRMLAAKVATDEEDDRIPVFIELKNFFPSGMDPERRTICELLKEYMKNHLRIAEFEEQAFQKNPFLFIFDGIDEIPNLGTGNMNVQKIIENLTSISGRDTRIIISSRPAVLSLKVHEQVHTKEYPLIKVAPFNDRQVEDWLTNWFEKVHSEIPEENRFKYSDIGNDQIKKEVQTPLILYMLSRIFQMENLKPSEVLQEGGIRRIDIYQRFIDWTVKKAKIDLEKDFDRQMPKGYRRLLGEIAYAIFAHGKGEQITESDFKDRLPQSLRGVYEKLKNESCLALAYFEHHRRYKKRGYEGDEVEGHFEFQHKSFREYLSAERVLSIFLRASMEDYEKTQDDYQVLIGDRFLTDEKLGFLMGLLDQLIEASDIYEKDPGKASESINSKEGLFWRFSECMDSRDTEYFGNIDKKVFDIACRWMQDERPFIPEYFNKDKVNIDGIFAWRCPEREFFAQNKQIISFLVVAHLARRKFGEEFHIGSNWLVNLIDLWIPDSNATRRLMDNLHHLDLSELYLAGTDLSGAKLDGANLSGAKIGFSRLSGTYLAGANLRGALLMECNNCFQIDRDLFGSKICNFSWADLSETMLHDSDFVNSIFIEADLSGANLTMMNLSGVDLTGAKLIGSTLKDTNLTKSKLIKANLTEAKITNSTLIEADLTEADLTSAKLTGNDLTKTSLLKANLIGTDFNRANLSDANLTNTIINYNERRSDDHDSDRIIQKTSFRNAILKGARFSREHKEFLEQQEGVDLTDVFFVDS